MKRVVATFAGLVVLLALGAAAYAGGLIPGTEGCVLRSVDKAEYVAENEAVFFTIPLPDYLRVAQTNTYSVGIPSPDACLPFENSPPYDAYVTWHVYIQPPGEYPRGYDRRLLGPEWVWQFGGGRDETFRRGRASLVITATDDATSFSVDHRRYATSD